jgi:hypothetical protein
MHNSEFKMQNENIKYAKGSPPAKGVGGGESHFIKGVPASGRRRIFVLLLLVFSFSLLTLSSCKDDNKNPYDDSSLQPPPAPNPDDNLEPGSFQYIHAKVFKPTCANSGCHDGTFEPDFRTVNSSYNSLVYQPVIKNDFNDTYTYRVQPYNADLSVLKNRLTVDIDGVSGIMPLSVDPNNTDWVQYKTEYIQDIINWINNGAKDMFGNPAQPGNFLPQVTGVAAFKGGTSQQLAGDANNVIIVPAGTQSVDVLFALQDDSSSDANIGYNKFKFSTQLINIANAAEQTLQTITPQLGIGFYGDNVQFTRKASINTSTYLPGTIIFVRIYVNDEDHVNPSEIPSDGTSPDMVNFFTLRIQ